MALSKMLNDAGLFDHEKWLKVFENQLGIESPEGLKYIGIESYPTLLLLVREPREKRALQKLLKVKASSYSYPEYRSMQKKMLLNRCTEIRNVLQKVQSPTKGRQNYDVKELENYCRELFQVARGAWIEDAWMEKLKGMLQNIEICKSEDESEAIFLTQLSGGLGLEISGSLAFKGVLMMDEIMNDFIIESSKCMLTFPTYVQLDLPLRSQFTEQRHFRNKKEEENFFHQVARFGYLPPDDEHNLTDVVKHSETYCCTVRYWFLPMASFFFDDYQLVFSPEALSHLKSIDQAYAAGSEKSIIESEAKKFLEIFGSHFILGPLHFGGLYICKCFSHDVLSEHIKIFHNEVINFQMRMAIDQSSNVTSVSQIKGISGDSKLKEKTYVQVISVGGPQNATGFPDWKNGLIANNRKWKLIDWGVSHISVWDIILMNHRQHFKNPEALAMAIQLSWKKCYKTNANLLTNSLEAEFKEVIKELSIGPQLQSSLNKILEIRRQIENQLPDPKVWASVFLPCLQDYICSIITTQDKWNRSVKSTLRGIVNPLDLGINPMFSSIPHAVEKLFNTNNELPLLLYDDFEGISHYFKFCLGIMASKTHAVHPYYVTLGTKVIEQIILLLRKHLAKTGQKYEELLVVTVLHALEYKTERCKFSFLLSRSDVEYLDTHFLPFLKVFF